MFVLDILIFVLCVVLAVVIFRFKKGGNKVFSITSKLLSVILLFLLMVNILFGPTTWQGDLFTRVATIICFLLMIFVQFILEFPSWEDWIEYW